MDTFSDIMKRDIDKATMTAVEIKAKMEEIEMYKELYKNPFWVIVLTYAEILLPIGLLVPIISALILMKKPQTVDVQ